MSLRAESLSVSFGQRRVLSRLDAEFPAGEVGAIVGPNGAGKTTLLRTLLGAIHPTRGHATLGGTPVRRLPARERGRRIAYLPHAPAVSFTFSVEQVVQFGLFAGGRGRRDDRARIDAALERVELADRARDAFGTLSAGQRQRAALARALAQLEAGATCGGTRVLLADEPVGAMDPRHAIASMRAFRGLAEAGVVVVLVVHDMTLAARFADRVLVLDAHGRRIIHAPPGEALEPGILERVFATPFNRVAIPTGGEAIVAGAETGLSGNEPARSDAGG